MAGPIFPKTEFEERWARAHERMSRSGLRALIAYSPGNQFWLTGFTGASGPRRMSEYSHQLMFPKAVLPLEGEPALTGLKLTADAYAAETHVRDIRPVVAPLNERPVMIRHILEGSGVRTGRVGIDLGALAAITPGELDALRRELPHLELVDATGLFSRLRMIKTPAEIACLRRAVEIQNRAFRIFASRISRRMTERDLIFEMVRAQGEAGATDIGFVLSTTHPACAFFRAQSAEQQMTPGELHWFDAGSTYKGYTCDYDILLAWGDPTADEVAVHKLVRQVYDEALQAWRPGRPVAEIANDTIDVIRRYGLNDPTEGAYLGHSMGFEVVEWPWFSAHASPGLRLEPGMVIAPEWFASTSQGVFPWEENFLVTETGLEKLSDFPQELCVIAN